MINPLPNSNYSELPPAINTFPKKEYINKANEDPRFKDNGIKAVSSGKHKFYKAMTFLFILIIATGVGGVIYLANNGNFKSLSNQVCGSLTCQACPATPACNCAAQTCTTTCPSVNFSCPTCINNCGNNS